MWDGAVWVAGSSERIASSTITRQNGPYRALTRLGQCHMLWTAKPGEEEPVRH
jgi:hypothetical protein